MNCKSFLTQAAIAVSLSSSITAFTASTVLAEPVTLTANDGSSKLSGDLVEFKDGFYVIKTTLGQMRMSAARVSCEGAGCPQVEVGNVDMRIVGSNTIGEGLMPLLISGYANFLEAESEAETSNDPAQVVYRLTGDGGFGDPIGAYLVTSKTSGAGFSALLNDDAEVAVSTRRIYPDEARALKKAGGGNMVSFGQENVIAADGLLIAVHPSNPVGEISIENLAKIYTGQIDNWSQIGGPDLAINIYSYGQDTGSWKFFDERVVKGGSVNSSGWTTEEADEDMARSVNADVASIGYLGFAFQRGTKALDVISSCGIKSSPSTFSTKTEDYPLGRRIYAYNRADNTTEDLAKLMEYATSSEADGVILKSGFIDLSVARATQSNAEDRMRTALNDVDDPFEFKLMRNMVLEMVEWDRLSSTFRFGAGSSRLDNKAELDMRRLVDYLATQPAGTQVSTVGFTDSTGAFSSNQSLSEGRANQVLVAIQERAGDRLSHIEFIAQGYGELSPVACNTSAEGMRLNRRVEIWVRN